MTDDPLSQIKNIDIFQVIGRTSNVALGKVGRVYQGPCPFHTEDTPSLTIFPKTNSFYCFGCHAGGSVIDWICQIKGYNVAEAIDWLVIHFGLSGVLDDYEPPALPQAIKPQKVGTDWIAYWHDLLIKNGRQSYFEGRGLNIKSIQTERLGWNGSRYTIPVWRGQPGNSACVGVRLRASEHANGPKYIGLKNRNPATIWGRWYCRQSCVTLGFAGELDALLANQDGYKSWSLVNGMTSFKSLPPNWPRIWFPRTRYLLTMFDRKEAHEAGKVADYWVRHKGEGTAEVIHWTPGEFDDYTDYRQLNTPQKFLNDVLIPQVFNPRIKEQIIKQWT